MWWAGRAFEGISRGTVIAARLAVVLALVVSYGCAGYVGWRAHADRVAAAELREGKAQAEVERKSLREDARIDAEIITASARRDVAKQQAFREIREEVPHAVRPAAPVAGVPPDCPVCDCHLGAGFVRVWNDALTATVPNAATGAAQAAARSGAAAADPDAGTVSVEAVLSNHVDNAEIHAGNRGQCEDLLAWHDKQRERRQ
jgi:hypothetical protein